MIADLFYSKDRLLTLPHHSPGSHVYDRITSRSDPDVAFLSCVVTVPPDAGAALGPQGPSLISLAALRVADRQVSMIGSEVHEGAAAASL